MRPIIFALILSFSTAALAQDAKPIELAPDAPDRHIVVRGDTLWGISSKFLKDPYRWPEVWKMNAEQVKNPHRIYPGQVFKTPDVAAASESIDPRRRAPLKPEENAAPGQ